MDCERVVTADTVRFFQFDHLDGHIKLFIVSRAKTPEQFDSERLKCDMVCKICHLIRTAVRRVQSRSGGGISKLIATLFGHMVLKHTNRKSLNITKRKSAGTMQNDEAEDNDEDVVIPKAKKRKT